VVLPEKHSDKSGPAPFITNLDVSEDDSGSWTIERIERYSRRGAIETSYKKIKEFAAWTTSKAFEVRLYHFGMAAVLYNTWLLVDFLIQTLMNVEVRVKPRLSASRFLWFLDDRLDKLIQH
jgi:IS4 transposase